MHVDRSAPRLPHVHIVLLLIGGLVGCASSGSRPPGATTSTPATVSIGGVGSYDVEMLTDVARMEQPVDATPREVWAVLGSVFDQLEIEATEIDPRQRIMGNQRFRPRRIDGERPSRYVECGRDHGGAYADTRDLRLSFGVQLLNGPGGGTLVASVLTGSVRPRDYAGEALPCQSKRTLEGRLLELILERLGDDNLSGQRTPFGSTGSSSWSSVTTRAR